MQSEPSQPRQPPTPDRGRHVVRGIGSLTIQSVLNAVLGFVFLASLVRFLPQTEYGTYSSVQVVVGLAGSVSIFGLGSAAVYFLASRSDDPASAWGAAKAALYLTIVLSGAASLFMVALAPYLSDYFGRGTNLTWAFYLGALWLFVSSVATPLQSMLQGLRRYATLARVLLGARFIAVAFAVVSVAVFQSLAGAIISAVIYFGLILLGAAAITWRELRGADPRPYYSQVMRYAYLLGLAGIVVAVAGNADIVVVGGYLSLGPLGVYNAAIQISSVLSAFFVAPLVTALFAEASLSSKSEGELKQGTGLALRFSMVTLLPASLLAAAMAPQLFGLFSGSGSYNQGIPYLQVITLFYTFTAIQTIAISVLQGVGKTREVLAIGAITALGEVALSASLVPGYGLAGATLSRVAIFVVGCGLSLFYIRSHLPNIGSRFIAKALTGAVVPSAAVYALTTLVSDRVLTLVPYTLLGAALFVGCAKALKLLTQEDRVYLSHLVPGQLQWVLRFF